MTREAALIGEREGAGSQLNCCWCGCSSLLSSRKGFFLPPRPRSRFPETGGVGTGPPAKSHGRSSMWGCSWSCPRSGPCSFPQRAGGEDDDSVDTPAGGRDGGVGALGTPRTCFPISKTSSSRCCLLPATWDQILLLGSDSGGCFRGFQSGVPERHVLHASACCCYCCCRCCCRCCFDHPFLPLRRGVLSEMATERERCCSGEEEQVRSRCRFEIDGGSGGLGGCSQQ